MSNTDEIILNTRLLIAQCVSAEAESRLKYLHKVRHYIINEMYVCKDDKLSDY